MKVTRDQILALAPNARGTYLETMEGADYVLNLYRINHTAARLCHFMAQVMHESGGLTVLREDLNYSAKRLRQVWPNRFPTLESAQRFDHDPVALGREVYNGRMGNREGTDDGYTYRGRGLLQITGRDSYAKYGERLGVDLVASPDLAIDPRYALQLAAAEWDEKGCNPYADKGWIVKITKAINGGTVGLAERREWLAKAKKTWS